MFVLGGYMRMSAKYAVGIVQSGVGDRSRAHLFRQAEPAGVELVYRAGKPFLFEVELLHLEMNG